MATSAQITERIAALEAVLGTGATAVTHAGKRTEFGSSDAIRNEIYRLKRLQLNPRRPPSGLAIWRTGDV